MPGNWDPVDHYRDSYFAARHLDLASETVEVPFPYGGLSFGGSVREAMRHEDELLLWTVHFANFG